MASMAAIAHKLGLNPRKMAELLDRGIIDRQPRGGYVEEDVLKQYLKHLREVAAGRFADGDLDLGKERARLAKEQADAKEMENMVERGELLYIDDVIKDFEDQLMKCKTKLLAVPTKVAAEVFAAQDVPEVQDTIEQAIRDALSELVGPNKRESAEDI